MGVRATHPTNNCHGAYHTQRLAWHTIIQYRSDPRTNHIQENKNTHWELKPPAGVQLSVVKLNCIVHNCNNNNNNKPVCLLVSAALCGGHHWVQVCSSQ